MEYLTHNYDYIALLAVAGIAIIISILDLLGLLEHFEWFTRKTPRLTLLLLSALAAFIVYQDKNKINKLSDQIQSAEENIITQMGQVQGVQVLRFKNITEVYNYIAGKISSAEETVDDITWGSRKEYRTQDEKIAYQNYLNVMAQSCQKQQITYREISSLANEHYFKRAENLLKYYNYRLGYHDISHFTVPLMSFIIIDSKEVMMGFYRVPTLSPEGEVYLSIKNPVILSLYRDYFETLWASSIKLKEGDEIDTSAIGSIKARLNIK